jgi:hypothetical protein
MAATERLDNKIPLSVTQYSMLIIKMKSFYLAGQLIGAELLEFSDVEVLSSVK